MSFQEGTCFMCERPLTEDNVINEAFLVIGTKQELTFRVHLTCLSLMRRLSRLRYCMNPDHLEKSDGKETNSR